MGSHPEPSATSKSIKMNYWKITSITLVLSCLLVSTLTAQNWWKNGISGEGPVVEKTLKLDAFEGITLAFSGDVYIQQGSTQSVKVEGQQNIIDNILTEVSDKHWKIKFDRPVKKHEKVKVYITIPTLTEASLSGSGNIYGKGKFSNLKDVNISLSGSGNIDMEVDANTIESRLSGSGNIVLAGAAEGFSIRISGSGNVKAYDLDAENCKISISGSGNSYVTVDGSLDVKISGSGDVKYKGSPRVNSKISGSGDVEGR